MHYKNGREAKELDHVIAPTWRNGIANTPTAGVLHSLNPAAQSCNGQITYAVPGNVLSIAVNVGDCIHAEDAFNAVNVLPTAS